MSFFDSEVVRAEMAEINELQEEIYGNVFKFPTMKTEDKKYHVEILERLLVLKPKSLIVFKISDCFRHKSSDAYPIV